MNTAFDASAGCGQPVAESSAVALTPTELENLIECWRLIGVRDPDRDWKRYAFERMRQLIAMRSPETVSRMEVQKGLR